MNWKQLFVRKKYIILFVIISGLLYFFGRRPFLKEGFQEAIPVPSDAPEEGKKAIRDLKNPDVMCPPLTRQQDVFKEEQDAVVKKGNPDHIQTHVNLLNKLREAILSFNCENPPDRLPDAIRAVAPAL